MINVVRAEFLKLRTIRAVWVIAFFVVALPLLFVSFDQNPTVSGLLTGSFPSILLIGVIGVMCSTQEYSQGTIRISLAATPRRWKVFAAKGLVMGFTSASLAGVILLAGTLIGGGGGESGWNLADKAANCWAFVAVAALTGVLGSSLGLLLRSSPGASTAIILWPTLLEALVSGLLITTVFDNDTPKWFKMPFSAGFDAVSLGADAVTTGVLSESADVMSRAANLGYFVAFVAVITVASSVLFSRRDA